MDILLFRQSGILTDKISVTIFQNIFGQALQCLFLHHFFNDLSNECRKFFQRFGEIPGVFIYIFYAVYIWIFFPLFRII